MGILSSRQQPTDESDEIIPAHVYKYPPKSGTFFGTHFMMGGERFEIGQGEAYLFGENNDLNFLGAKPVQFPYPQSTSSEPTRPLYCSVAIRRDSLKFTRPNNNNSFKENDDLEDQTKYNLEFIFDCDAPCTITIHYFCTEESTANGLKYISKHPELTSKSYQYDIGANQTFNQTDHLFSPSSYKTDDLLFSQNSEIIPVVIHCVAESLDSGHGPQSHSTFAIVEQSAEGHGYVLKPLKQKLNVDGVCYLLQEIYGIENKNVNTTASIDPGRSQSADDSGESGAECVVCMSDLRDTLILPCRHLCLCSACAETLRYKASNCPICRSPFRALLQIKTLRKIRATLTSKLPANGEHSSHLIDAPAFLNRYEQVPLIEALNGPIECPTAITLPHIPTMSTSQTAPASLRMSPRAPPRRGQSRKKTNRKPALPIQEVLTPQSIPTKSYNEDGDYVYCDFSSKRAASVDCINNPYLPGQAGSDCDDVEIRSVTCGEIVQRPELETADTGSEDDSDSSYRTPVAEKRTPRNFEMTEFRRHDPTIFHVENEDLHSIGSVGRMDIGGDDSDTNEIPTVLNNGFESTKDEQHSRDETPLSSFSVGSSTSTKPLLVEKFDEEESVFTTSGECEKL